MRQGNGQSAGAGKPPATVVAWDLPTRVFHWSLVLLIANAYATRRWGDDGLVWHTWNGYAVLVLLVWRVLWGFAGSTTARFRSFFYGPFVIASYGIDFLRRQPRHFLGHNPLGGLMVLALIGTVSLQGLLGLFSYDDHDANAGGPLASKVSEAVWGMATKLHTKLFNVILVLVALHVLAALVYLVWKRENLVRPMVTGRKAAKPYEDQPEAVVAPIGRALVCLIAAVLLVFGGIMTAGGKL